MKKPNCYDCKHKGNVPGSAHSSCNLLRNVGTDESEIGKLELLLASGAAQLTVDSEPAVQFDPHGIKNGWAIWPLNFDPIWLQKCSFFSEN